MSPLQSRVDSFSVSSDALMIMKHRSFLLHSNLRASRDPSLKLMCRGDVGVTCLMELEEEGAHDERSEEHHEHLHHSRAYYKPIYA